MIRDRAFGERSFYHCNLLYVEFQFPRLALPRVIVNKSRVDRTSTIVEFRGYQKKMKNFTNVFVKRNLTAHRLKNLKLNFGTSIITPVVYAAYVPTREPRIFLDITKN